jgi:hypothetical protein
MATRPLSEKALEIIREELQRSADKWPPAAPPRRYSPQQVCHDISSAFRDYRHRRTAKADCSASKETKRLEAVIKYATKLRESLGELAPGARSEPFLWWDIEEGRPSDVPDPQSLVAGIEWLATRADSALTSRNHYRKKGSKNPALEGLLSQLHWVWGHRLFPNERGISNSGTRQRDGGERYEGPLLDFVAGVLDAEGVKYATRETLGDRLTKIIDTPLPVSDETFTAIARVTTKFTTTELAELASEPSLGDALRGDGCHDPTDYEQLRAWLREYKGQEAGGWKLGREPESEAEEATKWTLSRLSDQDRAGDENSS